jgi:hypothetical protein
MVAVATVAVAVAVDRAVAAPLAGQRNMNRDYIIVRRKKECDQLSTK